MLSVGESYNILCSSTASNRSNVARQLALGKRFTKKQQMQWSHRGAHLLLQTRTRVVNGELEATFRQWYPAMCANDAQPAILSQAA
jgi:hypothetical protein